MRKKRFTTNWYEGFPGGEVEQWNSGTVEKWRNGEMEKWGNGGRERTGREKLGSSGLFRYRYCGLCFLFPQSEIL